MFLFEGVQNLNEITKKECLDNAIINDLYNKTTKVLNKRDLDLKELSTFADFEKRVLLLIAIMSVESRCKRRVVNKNTNASGIMQLTPICIKEIKKKSGISVSYTNVESSVEGGIVYINLCYNYFKNKEGLKDNWKTWTDLQKLNAVMYAYNAGPYGIINKISKAGYDPSTVGYSDDIVTMMDYFQISENLQKLKTKIEEKPKTPTPKTATPTAAAAEKKVQGESKVYYYKNNLVTETFLRKIIKNLLN